MKTKFEFINPLDIPEDLPPGQYATQMVDVEEDKEKNECVIRLEFIGKYKPDSPQGIILLEVKG